MEFFVNKTEGLSTISRYEVQTPDPSYWEDMDFPFHCKLNDLSHTDFGSDGEHKGYYYHHHW